MHRNNGQCSSIFQTEVSITHSIKTVIKDGIKAQKLTGNLRFCIESRTTQSTRTKRRFIQTHQAINQSRAVPLQHLHVSQEIVPNQNWLSMLKVCKARQHTLPDRFSFFNNYKLQIKNYLYYFLYLVTGPKSQVQSNLVISASGRMELLCYITYPFHQGRFNIHVNVFVFSLKL